MSNQDNKPAEMVNREKIIQNYIDAYNQFDIDRMVADIHDDVLFENIQNGEVNMKLEGVAAFRQQAEQAKNYFRERKQTVTSFKHSVNSTETEIIYHAVLAMDFPDLKPGRHLV